MLVFIIACVHVVPILPVDHYTYLWSNLCGIHSINCESPAIPCQFHSPTNNSNFLLMESQDAKLKQEGDISDRSIAMSL